MPVAKGRHALTLRHPSAVDDQRRLDFSSDMHVNVIMFARRPDAVQVKPAYPGASVNGASFLDDGRVALAMGLPAQAGDGMVNQAWVFDPATGTLTPFAVSGNPRAGIDASALDSVRQEHSAPRASGSVAGGDRPASPVRPFSSDKRVITSFIRPPEGSQLDGAGRLVSGHDHAGAGGFVVCLTQTGGDRSVPE